MILIYHDEMGICRGYPIDIYCYRARKYIGARFTAMGDGVGEHAPANRLRILRDLSGVIIELDTKTEKCADAGDQYGACRSER